MPRNNERESLTTKVKEYIANAEACSAENQSLDVKSVAEALKVSRTTLYKYNLNVLINDAQKQQHQRAKLSGKMLDRQAYSEKIRELAQELERERERNKGLVAQIILMEANAARLGFDPEEMYKTLPKPDRSVSRAGQRHRNGGNRWNDRR